MKKRIVLLISNLTQANACGFLKELQALHLMPDEIICLLQKKSAAYYMKLPFRAAKHIKPAALRNNSRRLFAGLWNKRPYSHISSAWETTGLNSWDLLTDTFNIKEFADSNNIPFSYEPALNADMIRRLVQKGPALIPFYGGGIVGQDVLQVQEAELLNAHMGEMPRYRGMNVLEWAVLEGQPTRVSVMVLNQVIDGGDVILHKDIPVSGERTVKELRRTGYIYCYKAMAEAVASYVTNPSLRIRQPAGAKYYYRMHPALRKRVEKVLSGKSK